MITRIVLEGRPHKFGLDSGWVILITILTQDKIKVKMIISIGNCAEWSESVFNTKEWSAEND